MTDEQKAAAAQVQSKIDAENKSFEEKKANIKKLIKQAKGKIGFGDNDKKAIESYNSQLEDLENAHKSKIEQFKFELTQAKGRVATPYEVHKQEEAKKAEEEKQERIEKGEVANFGELGEMKANIANKMNNDEGVKKAQEQFRKGEIDKKALIEAYKKVDPINGEGAALQYALTGSKADNFKEGFTDALKEEEVPEEKTEEVPEEKTEEEKKSEPVPVVEPPEVPNKEEFDENKKVPEEKVEAEVEPVENKEEAKTQSKKMDDVIAELEDQLANAPDEITRQELEVRLKNAKHAKELYDSMMELSDEEIAKRYSSRSGMDDFIKRQRAGGFSAYYKREKDRLKDQLNAAKEAGDDAKVKKLEGELKELSGEKGYFIADSIETALRNLSSTYAGQAPSATSEWSKKQGDILKAETERWNQHWNEQMQGIDADFAKKYEENDARRQAWNDIKNNEAAQMAAKRLGLLDDTFNAQAAINLQNLFGNMGTAKALMTMAQMQDYGPEDMAGFILASAANKGEVNIDKLVGSIGDLMESGVQGLEGVADFIVSLSDKLGFGKGGK